MLNNLELFFLGLVVFIPLFIASRLARRGVSVTGPALVLTQFETNPSDPKILLNLVGRPEGIIGWFLSTVGVDITTTLSITQDFVCVNQSSLSGRFRQTAPVHNIASTHCGYSMNLGLLIFAGLALFGGLIGAAVVRSFVPFVIGLIVALVLIAAFFFSKYLLIAFETSGGMVLGVRFKKGLIEGLPVGIEQLSEVIARFNQQLERNPSTVSASAPARKVEQWYYTKDGQKVGPLSASELRQMVRSGQLSSNDMLWKDGMANWEPVHKFKW